LLSFCVCCSFVIFFFFFFFQAEDGIRDFHVTGVQTCALPICPIPDSILPSFENNKAKRIGIAPFAQHEYKVWPLHKMEELIARLADRQYAVYIFGGGAHEKNIAETWANRYLHVHNTIGLFS